MENTLENKAKFFALYWGQKLSKFRDYDMDYCWIDIALISSNKEMKIAQLELKSPSSISDEDAIEVAKIACPILFFTHIKGHIVDRSENGWITVKHPRNIKSVDIDFDGYVCVCNEDVDYQRNPYVFTAIRKLQELGYYIGDGSEIDYGWVKLKEASND